MKKAMPFAAYCFIISAGFFIFARQSCADVQADSNVTGNTLQAEPEKLPDPFLTDEEWRFFASQDKNITWTDPNISAIFYSPRSSTVIVSGRVLSVNDFIDGRQIIAIRPESVVLKDKKGTYVVKMGSVLQQQPEQIVKTE